MTTARGQQIYVDLWQPLALSSEPRFLPKEWKVCDGAGCFQEIGFEDMVANPPKVLEKAWFNYDALTRLTDMEYSDSLGNRLISMKYQYDSKSRISKTETEGLAPPDITADDLQFTVNQADQIVSDNLQRLYSYDADGNLTRWYTPGGQVVTAKYDALNRLSEARFNNPKDQVVLHRFVYDFKGVLVKHQILVDDVLQKEERFLNRGLTPVMDFTVDRSESEEQITEEGRYWYGPDSGDGVGGLLGYENDGDTYVPVLDRQRNIIGEQESSQLRGTRNLDPYGRILSEDGELNIPLSNHTKRNFEELGLIYYGYRFYHPGIGRWIQRDPLEEAQGFNMYQYCSGNPISYLDTDGRLVLEAFAIIALGSLVYSAGKVFLTTGDFIKAGQDQRDWVYNHAIVNPCGRNDFSNDKAIKQALLYSNKNIADKGQNFVDLYLSSGNVADTPIYDGINFANEAIENYKTFH